MVWNERIDENLRKADAYFGGKDEGIRLGIEQGIEKGIEQGIEKGIEKGIAQNKREMVINMYHNQVSIEIIAKCANISISEVKEIINS